jgi:hypothetical protein
LFNGINDASVLRKTTPPGHATNYSGVPDTPGYLEVVPGAYHEPTGNTNLCWGVRSHLRLRRL